MNLRLLALSAAVAALLAPMAAHADDYSWDWLQNKHQPKGYYVGAGGLAVFQEDSDTDVAGADNTIEFGPGWGVVVNGGYAWGNGFRTEGEFSWRRSNVDNTTGVGSNNGDGNIDNAAFMGNVLYDFDTGTRFTPYIGAGIGAVITDVDDIGLVNNRVLSGERLKFGYQAIGGVSYAIDNNWALTTEYRYFGTTDSEVRTSTGGHADVENTSHNILVGFRYTFAEPEPVAPIAQPAPMPRPMARPVARPVVPSVPQSYMVFFDFNRATLTPEAKRIIATAAEEFKKGRFVRIVVTGHTDTVGTVKYNQILSERRAVSVKQEFALLGVPNESVGVQGVGKNDLLVPTNDQVREAQNRRAEIVFN